ncbi:MAG: PepSY-associated TM helix domain-containing protein [Agriterribacter sp.]
MLGRNTSKQKKKGKTLFAKIVAWLHLWPSIVSGIIVVFVCLTGTIVVYGDEIIDLSAGDAKYITPQTNRISVIEINDHLQNAYPGIMASEFVFFKDASRSIRIRAFDDEKELLLMIYMNPYTGEVIKVDKTIYFFFITAHLHAELLAGEAGHWTVIISTIIFTISCITGLILWWPNKWNKATRLASFTIKWKAKFKRFNYDLHNVFGFYSLLIALVLSVTGLMIAFPSFMNVALQASGIDAQAHMEEILPKADSTKTSKDLVPFAYKILTEQPDKASASIWAYNLAETGAFVFTAGKSGLKSFENASITVYDRYTGEKLSIENKFIKHEKAGNTIWQLHMGQWWGWFGKLSTFLAGLIATSLPVTGFLIWWGRRNKATRSVKIPDTKNSLP